MQNNPDVHIKEIEKYFSKSDSSDYRPDIFPLGYHVKRNEPRLIYVMPLTMTYEGESIAVKSKNFSATGLQIFIPRKLIVEGKTVQLTFEQFKKEYNADMGDESVNFDSINYLFTYVLYHFHRNSFS